jgi:hypothetical protein
MKSSEYKSEFAHVKKEWGVRKEREREKDNSGLLEWEMKHWTEMEMAWVRNGVGQKWPLVKKDTSILSNANQYNK